MASGAHGQRLSLTGIDGPCAHPMNSTMRMRVHLKTYQGGWVDGGRSRGFFMVGIHDEIYQFLHQRRFQGFWFWRSRFGFGGGTEAAGGPWA